MSNYIIKLISGGEHLKLDFKFQVNDSRKIARTISAFSNTLGGKLLIGIKDNGVIAGVKTDEEFYMIQSAAHLFCRPKIEFTYKNWNIEGKTILEIDIPAIKNKPCLAENNEKKWLAYIRYNDQNLVANKIWLKYWCRQNSTEGTFIRYSAAEKILLGFLNQNDFITVGKYCSLAAIPRYKAENIIVNLLFAGTIEMEQNEKITLIRMGKIDKT